MPSECGKRTRSSTSKDDAAADGGHRRAEVAEAVHREDRGLVERARRRTRSRRASGGARRRGRGRGAPPARRRSASASAAPTSRGLGRVVEARLQVARARAVRGSPRRSFAPDVRLRVARDRDVVEVRRARCPASSRHQRAASDREARDVLDAGEPLLLGGGDELAVDDERRRGVAVVRVEPEDRGHAAMLAACGILVP